jgi:hypothetical protein
MDYHSGMIKETEKLRRKKVSIAVTNKWKDPEYRAKMVDIQKKLGLRQTF